MSKETIRVVVVGDKGVGKTSLIATLIKDQFIPNLQSTLPPVTIPRDFSSNQYSPNSTILIDTDVSDVVSLHREIKMADVIWLVYSDHDSCERVSLYWMMLFRSLGVNLPVILCHSKNDLSTRVRDEEFIPILKEFKEAETCIRCSSKDKFNVNQAFYICQRAVTHPIAPLFDAKEGELKPLAVDALKRIFFLSDHDQDGYLNDDEFLILQRKSFNKTLDANDFSDIKTSLMDIDSHLFKEGYGITELGFLTLNKLYAERGRHETTWGILRAFKYTNSLSLDYAFLYPIKDVPATASVELSPLGYRFLVDLFVAFDKDNDGVLNEDELLSMFTPTPGLPSRWSDFPQTTVTNEQGLVTLQGWLAQWSMTTLLHYRTTTSYLAYLGYSGDVTKAIKITKSRRFRKKNNKYYRSVVNDRKVFNCFVLGAPRSGKTSLLEVFLGRRFSEYYSPTVNPHVVVNSLELKGGKQCYLVLEELGEQEPAVLENSVRLQRCNVLCLTYDSSDPESFSYLISLLKRYPEMLSLPMIFVALKADLDKQQQRSYLQPDEFTESLFVHHPLHVSSNWSSSLNELFIQISEAAVNPVNATPGLGPQASSSMMTEEELLQSLALGATFVSVAGLISWVVYKSLRHR